jgi:gliding motility-associated-like protein
VLSTGNVAVSRCRGESYFAGGAYQTQDGSYYDTLQTSIGCDSVLRTDLTFVSEFRQTITPDICSYETFAIGGSVYNVSGTYIDTLTSAGGCDSIVTTDLLVYPDIGMYARPQTDTFTMGEDEGIAIDIITNSGITIVDYVWDPTTWLNCTNCQESAISVPEADVQYIITVRDNNNCTAKDTVNIFFDAEASIYIPNAFTPNQDGNNDVFYVYGRGFADFHLKIFDRWGELVFESFNQNDGWDGTYRGKLLNPGVFVYYVDVRFITGIAPPEYTKYRKGSVTLLR